MSIHKGPSDREKIEALFRKLGLPESSELAGDPDLWKFFHGVLDSLGGGIDLANIMAQVVEEEIDAGRKVDLDPVVTQARDRVINLSRGFLEAARDDGSSSIAAWFGAALAFAVVQFDAVITKLADAAHTGDLSRAGSAKGHTSRAFANRKRDVKIRQEIDALYATGYSGRAAAKKLAPKYDLTADAIRKKFKKSG